MQNKTAPTWNAVAGARASRPALAQFAKVWPQRAAAKCRPGCPRYRQAGMTLMETVIALAILLIVSTGIMSVVLVAITTTETQGHLAARTAEYAQDKIEQLTSLSYADTVSDTTQFPAANSGGTGLSIGGSFDPAAPSV